MNLSDFLLKNLFNVCMKYFLVLTSAMVFILSDSLSAYWGKNGDFWSLASFVVIAPIGYLLFGILNRNTSLAVGSGLVNMVLIIGNVIVSLLYFSEKITLKESFGLLLAFLAIILLG